MDRFGKLPFEEMDAGPKCIMREYNDELGRFEFVRVFPRASDVFPSFIRFYFPLVS